LATGEILSIVVLKFRSFRTVEEITSDEWIFLLSRCNVRKIKRKKGSCINRVLVKKGIKDRLGLIVPIVEEWLVEHKLVDRCLLELRISGSKVGNNLLFARLVDEVRADHFDSGLPVANAFVGTKLLVGEVLMVGMDSKCSAFEKRTVFLQSLNTREKFFFILE
jgi:hypothetical protein